MLTPAGRVPWGSRSPAKTRAAPSPGTGTPNAPSRYSIRRPASTSASAPPATSRAPRQHCARRASGVAAAAPAAGRSSAGPVSPRPSTPSRPGRRGAVQPPDRRAPVHITPDRPDTPRAHLRQAGHFRTRAACRRGHPAATRRDRPMTPGAVPAAAEHFQAQERLTGQRALGDPPADPQQRHQGHDIGSRRLACVAHPSRQQGRDRRHQDQGRAEGLAHARMASPGILVTGATPAHRAGALAGVMPDRPVRRRGGRTRPGRPY